MHRNQSELWHDINKKKRVENPDHLDFHLRYTIKATPITAIKPIIRAQFIGGPISIAGVVSAGVIVAEGVIDGTAAPFIPVIAKGENVSVIASK